MIISKSPQRGDTLVEIIIPKKYLKAPEGRYFSRNNYPQKIPKSPRGAIL